MKFMWITLHLLGQQTLLVFLDTGSSRISLFRIDKLAEGEYNQQNQMGKKSTLSNHFMFKPDCFS